MPTKLDGWEEYELGQLLNYEQPSPYIVKSTNYSDTYSTPVLTAGKSFIIGYTDETVGIYNSLPVIIFDDFTTSSQYVNFPFKVKSSAMKILSPNVELVLPKFIYYRMQIIQFDHSTHKRYWIQQYSKIKVQIPSIPEQERIVSKIEELFSRLDASVAELQTAKKKLKGYRQIVLREAFSCIKNKVFLRSLFDGTPQNGIYKPKSAYGDGTRILRIDGFYDGFINSEYLYKRVSLSQEEIQKYGLNLFDLVINRVNSMPYLGKCALVRHISEPTVFESNIMRVRLNSEIVFPEYITYFLTSDEGRKELIKNSKQAVNQASINQTDVGNVLVPLPADIALQKQIVSRLESQLSVCNGIEQTIGTSLQQAEALRQSILKQAFEGKL